MSVGGVSGYGIDFWNKAQKGTSSAGNASGNAGAYRSAGGSSAASGYTSTSDMVSTLGAAVKKAMSTLGLGANDKVTFATLSAAKEQMEQAFSTKVKADLKKLEVSDDIEFRIVTNAKGGIDVISDHPDKAKVEKYFKDNPEMVSKFQEIQAMSNIEEARKGAGYSPQAIRQRIQIESMVDWFSGSGQSVQQLMQYSSAESLYALAGVNRVA